MRTNICCQNGSASPTEIHLYPKDAKGNILARLVLQLPPLGSAQVNRIFDKLGSVSGVVDVVPTEDSKPVYCFGSVIDNATSDPTIVLPR